VVEPVSVNRKKREKKKKRKLRRQGREAVSGLPSVVSSEDGVPLWRRKGVPVVAAVERRGFFLFL
jgi:hypothetical protein